VRGDKANQRLDDLGASAPLFEIDAADDGFLPTCRGDREMLEHFISE